MTQIDNKNNRPVIDYMARDFQSFKQAMIDSIPQILPQWTDRSEADFGIVLIEMFAHMADILSYYQDRIANESFLSTAQERRSVIQHLGLIGYHLETAAPASAELSLIFSNDKEGTVTIHNGDQFATESSDTADSVIFEYVGEANLEINLENDLEQDSAGQGFKKYSGIKVQEGQTIKAEILGQSDGNPNQVFQLAHPKLIPNSLQILVYESTGTLSPTRSNEEEAIYPWQGKENLVYSRSNDEHYFIQIDENDIARVCFGDNVYGSIPAKEARIEATYRVGGGPQGNVPPGSINVIAQAPQLDSLAAKVTNEAAATGGAPRESIEHAVKLAPTVFKSLQRGVTREDVAALAMKYPGIAKAKAQAANWNYIDLYVAPSGGGNCTDILKSSLLAYFEDKRMMTTLIRIKDAAYIPVYITAEVKAKPYYFREDVRLQVEAAVLRQVLDFDKLDFGQPLYLSKVYEAIEKIKGVEFVNISEFRRDTPAPVYLSPDAGYDADQAIATGGTITMDTYEIASAGHPQALRAIVSGGY